MKSKILFKYFLHFCINCSFLFFTGCFPVGGTVTILSLKNGETVTIQQKFCDVRLNFLEASGDNETFFLTTRDPEKKHCYIMQYNMQGEKLREYQLPFFTDSILTYGGDPCCAFFHDQKRFFYVEDLNDDPQVSEERVFYCDIVSGEKGMISGIDGKDIAISRFYVVNENLLLVASVHHTAGKGILYLINIKDKMLVAARNIPYPARLSANIPLLRLAVFKENSKVIDVYDLRTLQHVLSIPQNSGLYLTDCAFAPSGNMMLQAGLGNDQENICLTAVKNGRWEVGESIFSVSTKEYFVIDPQFYSDKIVLFFLSDNQKKFSPKQLCFFDLKEKKIIRKCPASLRGYGKLQGNYFIWED